MRSFFVVLAVLILSLAALAQPWQWQRFAGDYYNPTGFPQYGFHLFDLPLNHLGGDFDGDGRAEFLDLSGTMATLDADNTRLHWTVRTGLSWPWQSLENVRGFSVRHMAGRDAILVFTDSGIAGYAAHRDGSQWIWEAADSVTADLSAPPNTVKGVYGDFDDDGDLNAVFMVLSDQWYYHFEFWSLSYPGGWQYDSTASDGQFDMMQTAGILDGDFDEDGVPEVVLVYPGIDSWYWLALYDGNDGTVTRGDLNGELPGPVVGDFNGDGHLEGLFRREGYPEYLFVSFVPDSTDFVRVTLLQDLARMNGPILGNYRAFHERFPIGAENSSRVSINFEQYVSRIVHRTDYGWQTVPRWYDSRFRIVSGGMADLDGDGLPDMFQETLNNVWYPPRPIWYIYRNQGSSSADSFAYTVTLGGFLSNPDTVFSSPKIGDVDGDGRAELAMIATPNSGGTAAVEFYALSGTIEDTTFLYRSDLALNLPSPLTDISLGDVDGDGQAELFALTDHWRSYFRRVGLWGEHDIHLPVQQASWLAFADEDGDGDEDLFTPTDVWLNLSPDAVRPSSDLQPSEFTLSAYPNPFNPNTRITFALPRAGVARLRVFDVTGREIETLENRRLEAGEHVVNFDGSRLASGIYFAQLEAGGMARTEKMVMVK